MIPISEPYLSKNAKKYLNDCFDTNWISSQGGYIYKFQKALARYHNVKYCVLTSSCTTALHLALKALDIGEGDEVICPDLTFIAPANMVILSGAKLKLVDVDPETLAIDHKKIEKKITKKTKAIIVVHQFGHAADMDPIKKIAKKYKLKIIEDNAESIGGKYKNKKLGTLGDLATFSFYANKIITCGEGGAIITNSKKIAEKCFLLRDHGWLKTIDPIKRYVHLNLGYNYRMTNTQAAIGYSQMEIIDEILKKRNKTLSIYKKNLFGMQKIKMRSFKGWCSPVSWLVTLTLEEKLLRNKLVRYLHKEGIDCRPMINPVHQAHHFKNKFNHKDFKNSINISQKSIHLPSSTQIEPKKIKYICDRIKFFFNNKYK